MNHPSRALPLRSPEPRLQVRRQSAVRKLQPLRDPLHPDARCVHQAPYRARGRDPRPLRGPAPAPRASPPPSRLERQHPSPDAPPPSGLLLFLRRFLQPANHRARVELLSLFHLNSGRLRGTSHPCLFRFTLRLHLGRFIRPLHFYLARGLFYGHQDLTHLYNLPLLGMEFLDAAGPRRGEFNYGLVCFHLSQRLVFSDLLPLLYLPGEELTLRDTFSNIWELEFKGHIKTPL